MNVIEKKMDEEVEVTAVSPKPTTAIDMDMDSFSVTVDTKGDITIYDSNDEGVVLSSEEIERLILKLGWALEASSALSDRTPF